MKAVLLTLALSMFMLGAGTASDFIANPDQIADYNNFKAYGSVDAWHYAYRTCEPLLQKRIKRHVFKEFDAMVAWEAGCVAGLMSTDHLHKGSTCVDRSAGTTDLSNC